MFERYLGTTRDVPVAFPIFAVVVEDRILCGTTAAPGLTIFVLDTLVAGTAIDTCFCVLFAGLLADAMADFGQIETAKGDGVPREVTCIGIAADVVFFTTNEFSFAEASAVAVMDCLLGGGGMAASAASIDDAVLDDVLTLPLLFAGNTSDEATMI